MYRGCLISLHENKSLRIWNVLISGNWQWLIGSEGKSALLELHRELHFLLEEVGTDASIQGALVQPVIHCSSPARPRCGVRRASWEGHTQCRSRSHSGRWLYPPGWCAAGRHELRSQLPWHNRQTAWGHRASHWFRKDRVSERGGDFKRVTHYSYYDKHALVVKISDLPLPTGVDWISLSVSLVCKTGICFLFLPIGYEH